MVTTLAGLPGVRGYVDGTGGAVRFAFPEGIACDASGNVFIADGANNVIRKITPGGVVSTFAGTAGLSGSADGLGAAARFSGPRGLAADNDGNLYVADSSNHLIRKITPAGLVATVAGGAGLQGSADGNGSAARFSAPQGLTVDASGNVYVADSINFTVRKITPARDVTTIAGLAGSSGTSDGTGSAARFYYPSDIAVDSAGFLYVTDHVNHTVRRISPAGAVTTFAGSPNLNGAQDGTGSAARFYFPAGVAFSGDGKLSVADNLNHTIRQITSAGVVTTFAGRAPSGSEDGPRTDARFSSPWSCARDAAGNLYVADTYNQTIRKISPAGVVSIFAGATGSFGSADGQGSAARFGYPTAVATGDDGSVYVADYSNRTIRKITPQGLVSTLAGSPGQTGSVDGQGNAARFNDMYGIALDHSGNVYVADTGNHTVRKITPGGLVSTLAGLAGAPGSDDGLGLAARFKFPRAVAVDSAGNVFVGDTDNYTIRKIEPDGGHRHCSGQQRFLGWNDGSEPDRRGRYPKTHRASERRDGHFRADAP